MDIEEYEFTDGDIQAYSVGDESSVCFRLSHASAYMYKDDVIALSKHFKLDIALLNTLRNKFINSNHSCEHELLDMINRLELEK